MKKIIIIIAAVLAAGAVATSVILIQSKLGKGNPQEQMNASSVSGSADHPAQEEGDDPFSVLLNANIGDKVTTGVTYDTVGGKVQDNWYKLDENDENIYLIYGDYYKTEYISDALLLSYSKNWDNGKSWQTAITKMGTYSLTASSGSLLVDFMLDTNNWALISVGFEEAFPYRTISAVGSPTKEQIEAASEKVGGLGYDFNPNTAPSMIRPHPGAQPFDGCYGYWLATYTKTSSLYEVRCNQGGIRDTFVSNGDALRPVVCISKTQRERTGEEESRDRAVEAASEQAEEVNKELSKGTFQLGEFTLHYGKYISDDKKSSYTLNEDGSLVYESENGMHYTGKWEVKESEYDGWALFLTDDAGEEKMYWSGGDDWFDTAFVATMTYRYSSEETQHGASDLAETFSVGDFTLHFGRYISEDGLETYEIRSDGTYERKYEQTAGDTGSWRLGTNSSGEHLIIFDGETSSLFGEFVVTADDTFCFRYRFSTTYTYAGE